jgi:hypothetical protein
METSEVRLLSLFSQMSEEIDCASSLTEADSFAADRLRTRCRKRARLGAQGLAEEAISNFETVNSAVGNHCIRLDRFVEHNAKVFISEIFERYNRRFDSDLIQIAFDPRLAFSNWRFGPGASNGIQGTHTAEKISQPMSCTLLAKPLVLALRSRNVYFYTYDTGNKDDGTILVDGSRLTTVPKNEETERTIAIEPSGNMALQLSIGEYITAVLKSIGLDISTQQNKNKLLAKIGSLHDSLVTIDMSSASDMFSVELVRRLLPVGLYEAMMKIRSQSTILPDGRSVQLNMMSTMGNGFTFPMMTLVFVALIYAVRLKKGGPSRYVDWSKTGVYGDDIIVPKHESSGLIDCLEGCGFIVNHSKSFLSGPFRESCGGDFYNGVDVTPFYVKELATESHVYIAINKLFEWCAKHNLLMHRSLGLLRSFIDGKVRFVPEWCGDDAGFRTPLVSRRYNYLQVKPQAKRLKANHFAMMLAVGGYLEEKSLNHLFVPRPYKTRYKVKKARLPHGYLDGRYPLSRDDLVSLFIESYSFLLE